MTGSHDDTNGDDTNGHDHGHGGNDAALERRLADYGDVLRDYLDASAMSRSTRPDAPEPNAPETGRVAEVIPLPRVDQASIADKSGRPLVLLVAAAAALLALGAGASGLLRTGNDDLALNPVDSITTPIDDAASENASTDAAAGTASDPKASPVDAGGPCVSSLRSDDCSAAVLAAADCSDDSIAEEPVESDNRCQRPSIQRQPRCPAGYALVNSRSTSGEFACEQARGKPSSGETVDSLPAQKRTGNHR